MLTMMDDSGHLGGAKNIKRAGKSSKNINSWFFFKILFKTLNERTHFKLWHAITRSKTFVYAFIDEVLLAWDV